MKLTEYLATFDVEEMTSADRLLAVADLIERFPENWAQGEWTNEMQRDEDDDEVTLDARLLPDRVNCGTECCVAGWACAFADPSVRGDSAEFDVEGRRLLGLTRATADALFYNQSLYDLPGFSVGVNHDPSQVVMYSSEVRSFDSHVMAAILRYLATLPEGNR